MQAAEARAKRAGQASIASPGRRITMAPTKPTAVAVQRRARTVSFRISAAPTVANSGVVNCRAVVSAIGIWASAVNKRNMAEIPLNARAMCIPKRWVRSVAGPMRTISGTMNRRPDRLRTKAISMGWTSFEA